MGRLKILVRLTLLVAALVAAPPPLEAAQPKPGCPATCGSLAIPFPFGTGPDCYLDDSFLITCNTTHYTPPKPFLRRSTDIPVLDISTDDGLIWISSGVARDCYSQSGQHVTEENDTTAVSLSNFFISNTRNKFTGVGCNTVAFIVGTRTENYTTGCVAQCDSISSVSNETCSGIGCCQTSIPAGARNFAVVVTSLYNHSRVKDFNLCGYAFVAEESAFNFSSLDLSDMRGRVSVPVVLDWAVGNQTCEEAKKSPSSYACQAANSQCHNSTNGPGYRCNCSPGYRGNAYLIDGCQDIDECETLNPCNGTCTNLAGSFSCSCPKGYEGDGLKNGTGCESKGHSRRSTLLNVALGVSIGLLVLVVGSSWMYWILKKRKLIKLREQFFQKNGGLMLKQQLSRHEGSSEMAMILSAEDLKKATNNYDDTRVIGHGGFGTVYKGVLQDGRVVAIKKSKISDESQIQQFINEMVVLSQINHRNVVKLLGCCLETEVPLLVYEFITNGTLSDHIHSEGTAASLSWEMRLKIAAETAEALAYLHSATSPSIIHRDIKSTNILLDKTYTAKVSDFGASRLVPLDHAQLTTLVQGTLGYLDPEYFHSSQLTEKSDVYSFGVVLAELMTGQKALSFDRAENDRNLAMYFVSSVKEDRLFQILDDRVVNEGETEQPKEVARLVKRCLRVKGEDRPSMKQVAMELDGLRKMKKHPWVDIDLYPEETQQLLDHSASLDGPDGAVTSHNANSTNVGYDSIREQIIVQLDDGR